MPISRRSGDSFPGESFTDEGRRFKAAGPVYQDYPTAFDYASQMIYSEHGMVDALVFEMTPGAGTSGKFQYRVYLARRPRVDRTIPAVEAAEIPYELSAWDRKVHINSMYDAGQQGVQDMSRHSERFLISPRGTKLSADDISPDHDILGFDHPRTDMLNMKTASGKLMRTGGDTFTDRLRLSVNAIDFLDNNFTRDEVRKMNLFFEASERLPPGVAGACSFATRKGKPVSTISVCPDHVHEGVVTHEIVHALRFAEGRGNRTDTDMEEIETEYETTLRVQDSRFCSAGYYQYIPNLTGGPGDNDLMDAAVASDRVLATGATDKPLKGRRLTRDVVPNTVMRSRIMAAKPALQEKYAAKSAGVRQMIAEDADTYFRIKLPDKSITNYHISFTQARPPLREIKKHLKDRFGKDIEAWEWRDGRKVRLISRPKKTRSRKRTAKAKTPARKRAPARKRTTRKSTPARKLVAAEPYGLDAILGVPEGLI